MCGVCQKRGWMGKDALNRAKRVFWPILEEGCPTGLSAGEIEMCITGSVLIRNRCWREQKQCLLQ